MLEMSALIGQARSWAVASSTTASARLAPVWKEGSYHRPDPMAARLLLPRSRTVMTALIGLLIAMTLALGSGCAKQDWIDRTLVTVDVTGGWHLQDTRAPATPETWSSSLSSGVRR